MPDSSPSPEDRTAVPRPARSLVEDLRRRDDAALVRLVESRPDLGRPAPVDVTTLGVRALSPASLRWALDALDTPHLRALEAAVVAGDGTGRPVPAAEVADLSAVPVSVAAALLDDLAGLALAWETDGGYAIPRPVEDVLGPVGGLVATHPADVPAPADLVVALRDAPAGARDILDRLTWGPPSGVLDPAGPLATATDWLVEHGLLRRESADEPGRVVLPRPVALALRGGRLTRDGLEPPQVSSRLHAPAHLDGSAGARAADVLALVAEIADLWGHEPPRVLRAGGLAVRDLSRTAAHLDLDTRATGLLLETMRAARLLADDGAVEPSWAPTHLYDAWAEQDDALRWADLALAWRDMPRAPHRIGTRQDGAGVNALAASVDSGALAPLRRDVLGVLAGLEQGQAPTAEEVTALLRWHRPRRPANVLDEAVPAVLTEAEFLGVTGGGALTGAGRPLLAGDPTEIAAALRLPDPIDHVIVQADLTAIAPGRLVPHLATFLRRAAEIESRGGAGTYRFTPESISRLFDDGWDADDVLRTLTTASITPIPQPLEYLVHDVARRHGRARIGAAGCYVRSDDVAALDAVLARPEAAAVGLRRIAPTVLVSPSSPTRVMSWMREAGLPVLVEGADGAVVSAAAVPARAATPRPARVVASPPDGPAVVAAMRRAPDQSAAGTGTGGDPTEVPVTDPAVALSLLRSAVADGDSVWIGLAGKDGATSRRHVRPLRIDAGLVHGVDLGTGRAEAWSLYRIRGVAARPE